MSMTPMQIAKRASLRKLSNLISPVPADIDVAQSAATVPIRTIAAACGLSEEDYEPYGHFKAKLSEKIGPKLQAERGTLQVEVRARGLEVSRLSWRSRARCVGS